MHRPRLSLSLSAALLAVASLAAPMVTPTATSATTVAPDDSHYLVTTAAPVSTDEVLRAAQDHGLTVLSVQHNGPTNGELLVGDMGLGDALEMYRATDVANFGTEPQVVSFVVEDFVSNITVGGLPALSVSQEDGSSIDPTSNDDEVTAAGISKPWAPRTPVRQAGVRQQRGCCCDLHGAR